MPNWKKAKTILSLGAHNCFICNQTICPRETYKGLPNRIRAHHRCVARMGGAAREVYATL